jgi:REP element-mobilizing transposase RayT
MNTYHGLSHTTWEYEYRKNLELGFKALASQKKCQIDEKHLLHDYVHMLVNILTKYSVAQAFRFITGKMTVYITRIFKG